MAISWALRLLTNGIQLGSEAVDQWPSVGLQSC